MADINIKTDGTLKGTELTVDGKNITKDQNVTSIYFSSTASYKSKYYDGTLGGYTHVSYEVVDDEGKTETRSYGTSDYKYANPIGKITTEDEVTNYIGHEVDSAKKELIDKIVSHCEANNIKCPTREKLEVRSEISLKDKLEDLNIK